MGSVKLAAIAVSEMLSLAIHKDGATVKELVEGKEGFGAVGMSGSQVRRALGRLYGSGEAKVVAVRDGQEAWARVPLAERHSR